MGIEHCSAHQDSVSCFLYMVVLQILNLLNYTLIGYRQQQHERFQIREIIIYT